MKLSAIEALLLKLLHDTPNKAGEIVELLKSKDINFTLDQAQSMGQKLQSYGYIDYAGSRAYADAILTDSGIDYVKNH